LWRKRRKEGGEYQTLVEVAPRSFLKHVMLAEKIVETKKGGQSARAESNMARKSRALEISSRLRGEGNLQGRPLSERRDRNNVAKNTTLNRLPWVNVSRQRRWGVEKKMIHTRKSHSSGGKLGRKGHSIRSRFFFPFYLDEAQSEGKTGFDVLRRSAMKEQVENVIHRSKKRP